jgi:hypothetical protein
MQCDNLQRSERRKPLCFQQFASVAQLAEQLTLNQLVHGSSPCRGTTSKQALNKDKINFCAFTILIGIFDTCGVCPQCGKNWEDTQCLSCQRWSRHADWYHETIPDEKKEEVRILTA